jgi:hypothetical protein
MAVWFLSTDGVMRDDTCQPWEYGMQQTSDPSSVSSSSSSQSWVLGR